MSFDLFYFVMDMESRGRLFLKGGDDAARPTVITTSRSPTYAKSPWTPKVNPLLYARSLPTLLNGMLLHTPSHMHDRFTPTSTEAREEAQNIKPVKTEAWKRIRKKPQLNHRSLRPTPESPVLLHRSLRTYLRTDPSNRPRTVSMPLRIRHRRQTGIS